VQEPIVRPRPPQPIFLSTAERRIAVPVRGALAAGAAVLAAAAAGAALLGRPFAAAAFLAAAAAFALRSGRRARADRRS
jgi:hypothetical protein